MDKIEIDITYDCNLKCEGCNRSCAQAPTKVCITIDKILEFVDESVNCGIKWKRINILGGEPTLHPNFYEVIRLLQTEYVNKH